nr:Os12g0541350 [Ipomoea batatas]
MEDSQYLRHATCTRRVRERETIGLSEVGLNTGAGNDVDAALGEVEGLEHGDEGGTGVSFLVHAGAVIVHLYHMLLIHLRNLIHYPFEPLKRPLFPCNPVEIRPPRFEVVVASPTPRSTLTGLFLVVLHGLQVAHDVFHYAYHWGGADP